MQASEPREGTRKMCWKLRYLCHTWTVVERLRGGFALAVLLYLLGKTIMPKNNDIPADVDKLVDLLSHMCPGQDAQIKFRTNDHRELSGYWLWDIINLQHKHVAPREVRSRHRGKELRAYHKNIFRRIWRWKDAMKKLTQYQEMRNALKVWQLLHSPG